MPQERGPTSMLYFAYGSNMDRAAMAERCPGARLLGRARLEAHAYRIGARGYASAFPQAGARLHGVLWELGEEDLRALDAYEGLDEGLFRRVRLLVLDELERVREAEVYLACDSRAGKALAGYQEQVLAAARAHALPDEHLRELARWLPART